MIEVKSMHTTIFTTFEFLAVILLAGYITTLILDTVYFAQNLLSSIVWNRLASVGWHGRK